MPLLRLINPPQRALRWSIKTALLLVVSLFVLYPNPALLVRHVDRLLHLPSLIEPGGPGIEALAAKATASTGPGSDPSATLRAVERTVLAALPYRYDWQTWGVVNYFPTVSEALARAECDCKGRAVVAASILARLGFSPRIVADLSHVWVWTPEGELMSPRRPASGQRLIDAAPDGNRFNPGALISRGGLLIDAPAGAAFGLRVFPPLRTGLIALSVWLVLVPASARWPRAFCGAAAIAAGLVTLALSGKEHAPAHLGLAWTGIAITLAGLILSASAGFAPRTKKARSPEATEP